MDLRHAIVVYLDGDLAHGVVVGRAESLAAEADCAREYDLRVDPVVVENPDTRLGVVRPGVNVFDMPHRQRFHRFGLLAVRTDDRPSDRLADGLSVHHPHAFPVDHLVVRHPVLQMRGRQACEQVRGLRPVRIGIDDEQVGQG